MKKYIITVAVGIVLISALLYIFSGKTYSVDSSLGFEELCKKNGDQWMVMESWRDGKQISDEKCAGCMIASNHFCNAEEYVAYIKSKGFRVSEAMESEHSMPMMIAHAGDKESVDVHSYNVGFSGKGTIGNESELTFTIKEISSGKPISNLDTVHDKIMHVILVRNDLKYFDHIHPIQKQDGVFSFPYKFYAPGNYRIWIDFTVNSMQHIVDFDTTVSGSTEIVQPNSLSGLKVQKKFQDYIKVNEYVKLEFFITDGDGQPVFIKEKFLAANAHMIVIDESLEEFGHTHDGKFDGDEILSFDYKFMNKGMYKTWVQFSVDGLDRTAEFVVGVNG